MKRTILTAWCGAAAAVVMAGAQTVVAGPTPNPGNGRRYTLIQAADWGQARRWARDHGFDLATVEDAAENAWLFATFSAGGTRKYFIGLSDQDTPGSLAWSDGSTSAWRTWAAGEPGSGAPGQRCAVVQSDQHWYIRPPSYAPYFVMEASGPLRVPQEFAYIREAIQMMDELDRYDVELSNAQLTGYTVTQTAPAGRRASIRGTSPDASITLSGNSGGFVLGGDWSLEDLEIVRYAATTAIRASGGELSLRNVVLDGYQPQRGELVHLQSGATFEARSCVFSDAWLGFWSETPAAASFDNCITDRVGAVTGSGVNATFSNCTLLHLGGWANPAFGPGRTRLINSIVWDLSGDLSAGLLEASHCNIQGGAPGPGNIEADPMFIAPNAFELAPGSPCVDAGSAAAMRGAGLDLAGAARISGRAPDIGALEQQESPCLVDFNRDGFVDFFDYDDFVAAFEVGC